MFGSQSAVSYTSRTCYNLVRRWPSRSSHLVLKVATFERQNNPLFQDVRRRTENCFSLQKSDHRSIPGSEKFFTTLRAAGELTGQTAPGSHSLTGDLQDLYRWDVANDVSKASSIPALEIVSKLQSPPTLDHPDLELPIPSLLVNGSRATKDQAVEWCARLTESDLVERPVLDGSFLGVRFKPQFMVKCALDQILRQKTKFGFDTESGLKDNRDPSRGRRRILVEFSSPNIAKPFHAGHLRSTIIGAFIANLYEKNGWDVIRINYLGDWGKQFGLLAVAFEKYGDESKLCANPIGHLFDIYVKINKLSSEEDSAINNLKDQLSQAGTNLNDTATLQSEINAMLAHSSHEKARQFFKRLENADPEAIALWKRFRDISIEKYTKTYSQWNIKFDYFSGESQVEKSRLDHVVFTLKEAGLCRDEKGAVLIDFTRFPESQRLGKALVQKNDGSSLYLTRDIGEATKRGELFHFDKMIYVVASQQDLYMAQMLKVLEYVDSNDLANKCSHVSFGMIRGMSTRKGTVKFLDDILRDVAEKIHEIMQSHSEVYRQIADPRRTADILGRTAIIIQDMKGRRKNDYDFSLERMTSFEGDTGPYLQYSYVRLCSIRRKVEISDEDLLAADLLLLTEPHAIDLVRMLIKWPGVVKSTFTNCEPSTIVTYLFRLTHTLNAAYDNLRVVGSEVEVKTARMAMYEAARQVLWNGMNLLGLDPVDRM